MIKKLIHTSILVLAALILISCGNQKTYKSADEIVAEMKIGLESIDVQTLKEKLDVMETYFLLIDVRESTEHNFGYIPGSINISAGTILFNITNEKFWEDQMMYTPELEDEIVVYCKKGSRSIIAANFLRQLGYKNVKYLEGGWKNWEMNYPLLYEKNLDMNMHQEEADEGGC